MNSLFVSLTLAALCAAETFAAPLGTAFTYQGRLNDGGQPATGKYDFSFILYDAVANGATVGNSVYVWKVPVTNGLFTVQINENNEFGASAFNGSARWLEISTRTNSNVFGDNFIPLSPRQPITAAPNALFAQTAFAALNAANVTDGAITSSKLAPGAVTWAGLTGLPASFADGVDNDTTYAAGPGLTLSGANNQFGVNFAGSGNVNSAAHSDHGHFGANWAGNSSGFGLVVDNSSTSGSGLYARQGTGSGASVPFSFKAAIWGESSEGDAVYGASGSAFGSGVYGRATHGTGANYGVYGESESVRGRGVFGYATSSGGTNYGVVGLCNSTNGGSGVFGRLRNSVADQGRKSWLSAGVQGESSQSVGVAGFSDAYYGVFGSSVDGSGVSGWSEDGVGVDAFSRSGVALSAYSVSNDVIEAWTPGAWIFPIRVFRVAHNGNVYASGSFNPNGADFAEMLPAQDAVDPGDVLVIGEDGKLARSTQPYQENVAGVHATKPGLLGGAHDGADLTGKIPLTVVGVVPVKVSGENGSIKPGDKLTSSSTPGHAMRADKHAGIGTVIGKALEGFAGQQGVIQILVVLQ